MYVRINCKISRFKKKCLKRPVLSQARDKSYSNETRAKSVVCTSNHAWDIVIWKWHSKKKTCSKKNSFNGSGPFVFYWLFQGKSKFLYVISTHTKLYILHSRGRKESNTLNRGGESTLPGQNGLEYYNSRGTR